MHDLSAVLAALRREDSPLRRGVDGLTDCLCRALERAEREEDALVVLWRRETEFSGVTADESCRLRSLRTVYSVFIKLVAHGILGGGNETAVEDILTGQSFRARGIVNYCGADWSSWLLRRWDGEIEAAVRALRDALDRENAVFTPEEFRRCCPGDSLRRIYETMIPEAHRTALGEYYTPRWLADCILHNALRENGGRASELRFIDPTCGAGTFLTAVLCRIRGEGELPRRDAVAGFDINPLAVLTARTNYLAALVEQGIRPVGVIPVYLCDVLALPHAEEGCLVVPLSCGLTCSLPYAVCEDMARRGDFDPHRLLREGGSALSDMLAPYDDLTRQVIAELLLNRIFAYFEQKADIVVGNPPWVSWEKLSEGQREQSRDLWMEYGLYNGRGKNVRFLKDDISILITCIAMERFLADGGLMSFALRQAVLKSEKNGAMFRRFRIEPAGVPFRVVRVDDLGKIKPFAGVDLRAALVLMRKGEEQRFPVPYDLWERKKGFLRATRTPEITAEGIDAFVARQRTLAFPAQESDPASLWVNAPAEAMEAVEAVLGSNGYKARAGVFTGGANAVYWLKILGRGAGDVLRVTNLPGRARRRTETVEREIEAAHLYPLVQGHDIARWRVDTGKYILCPHTAESKLWPVEEERLRAEMPLTYDYLCAFRAVLDERRGFAGWEKELRQAGFYAVLRLGDYTFGRYKVAWRYIAQSFVTAVIEEREDKYLGRKLPLPNEKVMYVATEDRGEAYYLCGVLSSLPVSYCVGCYMNPTSISAHVLGKLHIPAYDPEDPLHCKISALCEAGHRETDPEALARINEELDCAAAALYGIGEDTMVCLRKEWDKN